jgi:hypothetical protein
MTDTPERIWVDWRPGLAVTNGPLTDVRQGWVRADLHDAALARVVELEGVVRAIINAAELRDHYMQKPQDHYRIGDGKSPKSRAKDAWMRALRKAETKARAAKKDAKS